MDKKILRKEIKAIRNSMDKQEAAAKSKKICENIENEECFLNAKNVMIYISANNEVDLKDLFFLNGRKKFFAPVCLENNNMMSVRLYDYESLSESKFKKNILEPQIMKPYSRCVDKLDLILVPGVVYDKNKNRIGYGAGYYDRFLAGLGYNPLIVGVCYEFQLVENIFTEDNDVKMDYIVTEKNIYT